MNLETKYNFGDKLYMVEYSEEIKEMYISAIVITHNRTSYCLGKNIDSPVYDTFWADENEIDAFNNLRVQWFTKESDALEVIKNKNGDE